MSDFDRPRRWAALNAALVGKGWPALSPFWAELAVRVVRRSKRLRRVVVRAGRRSGKSTVFACRLAVFEGLFGAWLVTPGDIGTVAFISVSRDEANQRLRTIRQILDVLGIGYAPSGDGGIETTDWPRPVRFRTFTASMAGTVGFTCVAAFADEVSRWRDAESGANPAREVLASLAPTLATTGGILFLISSPLGSDDAHARAFDAGNSEAQIVAHAATWEANPTLTEAECRELEPDDRVFLREYAAIPQAGTAVPAFVADHVWRMDAPDWPMVPTGRPTLAFDASSGGDNFCWLTARWCQPAEPDFDDRFVFEPMREGRPAFIVRGEPMSQVIGADGAPLRNPAARHARPTLLVDGMRALSGAEVSDFGSDRIIAAMARDAREAGAYRAIGDQHGAMFFTSGFRRHSMQFVQVPWTEGSIIEGCTTLRRLLRDRTIVAAPGPMAERLKRELLQFEERITKSGSLSIKARRTSAGHADLAAALITLAMAETNRELEGSPEGLSRKRHEIYDYATADDGDE